MDEQMLLRLTRGLSEYDSDTLRYLAACGAGEALLQRVFHFKGKGA